MMKCIFGVQINIEVFYKLIVPFWVCIPKHAQRTQIRSFISLQYLQKNMENEVDFLPVDEHKTFLQFDNITLDVQSQAYPKYPK